MRAMVEFQQGRVGVGSEAILLPALANPGPDPTREEGADETHEVRPAIRGATRPEVRYSTIGSPRLSVWHGQFYVAAEGVWLSNITVSDDILVPWHRVFDIRWPRDRQLPRR